MDIKNAFLNKRNHAYNGRKLQINVPYRNKNAHLLDAEDEIEVLKKNKFIWLFFQEGGYLLFGVLASSECFLPY